MGGGTDWCVNQRFQAGGLGKNILKINLKSGLISVARHAIRDCEKVVDIWMLDIENDRLVMSLV